MRSSAYDIVHAIIFALPPGQETDNDELVPHHLVGTGETDQRPKGQVAWRVVRIVFSYMGPSC